MKKMLIAFSIVLSQASFASITNSNFEARHQDLIEASILKNCGNMRSLNQIDSKEKVIKVDQGIRDIEFKTTLSGVQKIDQGIFDEYEIVVESQYIDMYDHDTKNWGVYGVSSVSCLIK